MTSIIPASPMRKNHGLILLGFLMLASFGFFSWKELDMAPGSYHLNPYLSITIENLKSLQYKNFMPLWNHKYVVLSKQKYFFYDFIEILNNFVTLKTVCYLLKRVHTYLNKPSKSLCNNGFL